MSRKKVIFSRILLSLGAPIGLYGVAMAQTKVLPANPVAPIIPTAPLTTPLLTEVQSAPGHFTITPADPKNQTFSVTAVNPPAMSLLQELARQAGKTLIIADAVRARPVVLNGTISYASRPADEIFRSIAEQAGWAYGNVGADIWLITPRPAVAPVVILPPQATPPNPFVIPRLPEKSPVKPPPGSQPFDFNGQTMYFVPLDK